MTPRSVADTAGGVEATTALRLPSAEEPPPPLRWGQWVVLVAGGVLVVVGVLHLVGASTTALAGAVAGGVVAAVGTGVWGWRANQRRIEAASLASVVGQLLRAPVVLRRVRWRGIGVGRIVRLRMQYTDLAAAVYGAQLGWRVAQAVEQVTGRAFVVRRQRERLRQLVLVEKPAQAVEEMTELDKQRARVSEVAAESFGVDATVTKIKTTDTLVSEFTVTLPVGGEGDDRPGSPPPHHDWGGGAVDGHVEGAVRVGGRHRHLQAAAAAADLRAAASHTGAQARRRRVQPDPAGRRRGRSGGLLGHQRRDGAFPAGRPHKIGQSA